MSRKYLNDKYCVRCNRKTPTPYLKDNYNLLENGNVFFKLKVVDVGCGNGRNSEFIKDMGHEVIPLDMVNDYGKKIILGKDRFPIKNQSIDVILCNYLLMFLNKKERNQLLKEIKRISKPFCKIMVELYPAKDSEAKNEEEMLDLQKEIFEKLNWNKIKYSHGRFIAQR